MHANPLKSITDGQAVGAALEENFAKKVTFFAEQHAGMRVHRLGGVACVDSGVASDTFNCVVGGGFADDAALEHAQQVKRYYQEKALPMAWWLGPSADPARSAAVLNEAGFVRNEVEVGMAAPLCEVRSDVAMPGELRVERVASAAAMEDFGRVLGSVFDPADPEVLRYYRMVAPCVAAADPMRLFVGYFHGAPVTIGSAFISERIAGVYDIATHPAFRQRGYGTLMTAVALQAAKESGMAVVGLQASSEGQRIYERLGFKPFCEFHVYGLICPRF